MPCKIESCAKPGEYIRGMCPMHYQRWRLRGDPLWEPETATIEDRFWAKVEKAAGCWTWTGGCDAQGYGAFKSTRMTKAHRFSWELHFGKITNGLWVLHRCDNPSCVRPDHLFLGTHEENMADMKAKGRGQRGERQHMAKLTDADVIAIRKAASAGEIYKAIGERFGISRANVSNIVLGNTWKHLAPAESNRGGREHENSKLTSAQAVEIVKTRAMGEPTKALAARYGVSRGAIENVLRGKTWSYATGVKFHEPEPAPSPQKGKGEKVKEGA